MILSGKNVKRYAGRPVGNSPELMPLDNSLNQDIHESVKTHVAATFHLSPDNEEKFSLSTPAQVIRAYERAWLGAPTSERIKQDVEKMLFALKEIKNSKGEIVKGLASREGHRKYSEQYGGGKTVSKESMKKKANEKDDDDDFSFETRWLHPHAKKNLTEQKEQLAKKLFKMKNSINSTRTTVQNKTDLAKNKKKFTGIV